MQVGKTKDQGLYNKPSDAVHPGALAAGTLPQYSTIQQTAHLLLHNIILVDFTCFFSFISRSTVMEAASYPPSTPGTLCCMALTPVRVVEQFDAHMH